MNTKKLDRLVMELTHTKADKRRQAAEGLSEADQRAIYPLIRALRDPDAGVQDAAMRSLTGIGGEITAYMVMPLLREDSYLRNTAMIIIKEIGPASVPLLYPLMKDKDDDIRKFSIDLLTEIQFDVDPDFILPLLKDPIAIVRASAAMAMGLLNYP